MFRRKKYFLVVLLDGKETSSIYVKTRDPWVNFEELVEETTISPEALILNVIKLTRREYNFAISIVGIGIYKKFDVAVEKLVKS